MSSFLGLKIVALLWSLIHIAMPVEGRADMASMLMQEEELNIERQLNILNKTPTKTIHALWGDTYDCIEIHKQPAFDHHLLKDHKIETIEEFVTTNSHKTWMNQVDGCPKGTVPIRRTTREDLTRAKLSSSALGNQYRAGISYDTKLGKTIYGVSGVTNVWNPSVRQDQFSSAEIALQSGSQDQINVIKFGWIVDPLLYGGNVTRSFAYWTADGGKNTGCYNTLCPGFIQVHPKYTPGMPFGETSKIGGTQITSTAEITLDNVEGKWWLTIEENIRIGYWPKELFSAFAPRRESVFWGGCVKSGIDGMSPPMCSGRPIDDRQGSYAGYMYSIQYVDMDNNYVNPDETESIIDCSKYYNATYFPRNNNLHFGGSGGADCK